MDTSKNGDCQQQRNKVGFGKQGETIAAEHLVASGWQIVERNWRNGRRAELDIIARDPQDVLVFIEVKTRRSEEEDFSRLGFEAITDLKVHRIVSSAAAYLLAAGLHEPPCRFDVIVLHYKGFHSNTPNLTHVQNAFHRLSWT
ncbi:MAG TPA: YraN family protein [Planktothrix sp.]|jgi:putative endonuclease